MEICGTCRYFQSDKANAFFGWCILESHRIGLCEEFPKGFAPSASTYRRKCDDYERRHDGDK